MKPLLPVLAFDKIGTPPRFSHLKDTWTSVSRLEKTLTFLTKHNYTFITPLELNQPLPAKPVLLVFFGGYQSFYTDVFPLLQQHRACATVCLPVDPIGTYNSWQDPYQEPWQNMLTAKQLDCLRQSGLVQFGTLGLTGENLLHVPPAIAREAILESIHRFQKLYKIDVCAAAFWPGVKDKQLARTRGICAGLNLPVFTSVYGKNTPDEKQFLKVLKPGGLSRLWLR